MRAVVVLPPKEGFSPARVGAIGLLVHRVALAEDTIIGAPLAETPFQGRHYVPLPASLWPLSSKGRYIKSVVRLVRDVRPSLVEVHNRPEIALALREACPQLPLLLVLHNDPQHMLGAETAMARSHLLRNRVYIAGVSKWLRERFTHGLGPEGARVDILPNCIDTSALPPPVARKRRLLFVGRTVKDKGADLFVRVCGLALRHFPEWEAVMIGADRFRPDSPQTRFVKELKKQAEASGVALWGYRPHTEVLRAMREASIVVVPSRWEEPFGMTALEAMACGAATVVSNRGGLPWVAGDGAAVADPGDIEGLVAVVEALMRDGAARAALGARGAARARIFDLPLISERLVALRHAACACATEGGV